MFERLNCSTFYKRMLYFGGLKFNLIPNMPSKKKTAVKSAKVVKKVKVSKGTKVVKNSMRKTSKWFYALMILVVLVLVVIRSFPYLLHGPFGFGYDTGIYKKTFEGMTSFSAVLSSQVYFLPSLIAYLFNLLHLPMDILLYYVYILFSCLIAWPLYLLTREFFGKIAGVVAVAIFAISYVQVFASEYYLFKAMIGAFFMLFGFYYYVKKSNWFYVFSVLLALTQLPQFLILLAGTGVASVFEFGKNKRFVLGLWGFMIAGVLAVFLLTPQHLINGWLAVYGALNHLPNNANQVGSFMNPMEFLFRESVILAMALAGFIISCRKKGLLSLQIAVVVLGIIIFCKLFFQNRFVVEMGLLLIPFAAGLVAYFYERYLARKKILVVISVVVLLVIIGLATKFHYQTTYPALNKDEQWALNVINDKTDGKYVLVSNSYYAPWMYGFSNKITLAPGIFESVWELPDWVKFIKAPKVEKARTLIDLANHYGKIYLFEGARQNRSMYQEASPLIKRIFDINGVVIYEISPSPSLSAL